MNHPLLCWDIVMEGIARRKEFAKDITNLQNLVTEMDWNFLPERTLENCIVWENKTIVVTNAALKIVLATKNIYDMNGYHPEEVIGRHPRMFQGEGTTLASRKLIHAAIAKQLPFDCGIVNYRKDGSLYICHIEGYPVFNSREKLVNFIALENVA